jgi:hypothetical protein
MAQVRLIVWCLDCRYQIEPDPGEDGCSIRRGYIGSRLARATGMFRQERSARFDHRREISQRLPHLRQIGPTPQVQAAQSGSNPGEFHTAV